MTSKERQQAALSRAQGGLSVINYPAIIEGFMQKGIPADQIEPRVNVLTFEAWKAVGRYVRRGEHGIKVLTWLPMEFKEDDGITEKRTVHCKPRSTTVFHVTQTEPMFRGV